MTAPITPTASTSPTDLDREAAKVAARVILELISGFWTPTLTRWANEGLVPQVWSADTTDETVDAGSVGGFLQLLQILATAKGVAA